LACGIDFPRVVVEPPRDPRMAIWRPRRDGACQDAKAKPRDLAEAIASRLRADELIAAVDVPGRASSISR